MVRLCLTQLASHILNIIRANANATPKSAMKVNSVPDKLNMEERTQMLDCTVFRNLYPESHSVHWTREAPVS